MGYITVCSYKKLAIFTTNVDAENQTLITHKCVCGALHPPLRQTAVTSRYFLFCRHSFIYFHRVYYVKCYSA